MMWVGSDQGKRNLDHGVCSGLITLQALTFFHELFWGFCQPIGHLRQTRPKSFSKNKNNNHLENTYDRVSQQLFDHIKDEITRVPKRIMIRDD